MRPPGAAGLSQDRYRAPSPDISLVLSRGWRRGAHTLRPASWPSPHRVGLRLSAPSCPGSPGMGLFMPTSAHRRVSHILFPTPSLPESHGALILLRLHNLDDASLGSLGQGSASGMTVSSWGGRGVHWELSSWTGERPAFGNPVLLRLLCGRVWTFKMALKPWPVWLSG